jgi:hypothetical protein
VAPNIDSLVARDGQGVWLWDRALWLLAPGAVVVILAAYFTFTHLTPPPQGYSVGEQPAETVSE